MSTHTSTDKGAEAERAAFEAWHRRKFATRHSTGQPTRDMHNGVYAEKYGPENQQQMWEAWQAARRAPAPVADGLPPLPYGILGMATLSNVVYYDAETVDRIRRAAIAADRQARALQDVLEAACDDIPDGAFDSLRASVPAAGAVQQPVAVGVKTWQERCGDTGLMPSKDQAMAAMKAEIAELRTQLARQSQGEIYTCKGKGGAYELLGVATGAGKAKLVEPLTVYRETAGGALYFRTGDDFAARMERTGAAPAPGNTAQPVEQVGEQTADDGRDWIVFGGRRMGRTYLAKLEREAARYRWLRDKSEPGICAFYLSVGQAFKDVKFARETVDDAIDAQIAAMQSTKGATDGAEGQS